MVCSYYLPTVESLVRKSVSKMRSTCKEDESVMRTFIGQTRNLSECAKCTSLLLDPVEAKCGHYFCRGCITELLNNSTGEQSHLCGICQTIVCKDDLKELNPKMSKITSSLQHFLQNFCKERGWKIDSFFISSANIQQNSISQPLRMEEKEKTEVSKTTAADIEEGSGSIFICSSSSSEIAHQSTLEPAHKVHQWLMTNPNVDPLAVTSEEDGEHATIKNFRTLSKTRSFESSKLLTPLAISSTGKDSSYDIVSAPSPPPSREIPQQMKRGRGGRGRGRGRTRKNALPISSGEPPAKKRGRSTANTPDAKPSTSTTPKGQPDFSPELDGTTASKSPSTATTSTPLTRSSKPSIDINSRIDRSKDSRNPTSSNIGEEEKNISIFIGNSCALPTNEALEKSSDRSARLADACEPFLNCVSDLRSITPNLEETPRPLELILADRSNIHVLPPAKIPSPQLDKAVSVPSTAYHLTPVSRPRVRNSLGSAVHDLQTTDRDFRRHSISGELRSGTGRRNVNFFHKGRIIPRKPVNTFKKQQIVFTRLGKLGPYLDPLPPYLLVSGNPLIHAQKCFEDKETQTFPPSPVSFSSVSTQAEPVEATVTSNKDSYTDHMWMNNQAPILPDKALSINSQMKSLDVHLRDEEILEEGPDESSEDAFMSAEPFKRARVLSSSDSEDDKMETKRKKPCPSVKSIDTEGPISLMSRSVDGVTAVKVPQRFATQETDSHLASKTVVMESDPDEDEGDILVATPPHPPPPKPVPCQKKVLTCSGLPRPQVKMVEDWARRIGAEVSLTYSSAVTHIIVQVDEENCAQRTLKFLYGVASGKWIVGIDWIHQCIRETRLIDEEPFEALDMDGEDGPRRARQTNQRNKLFEAFEFCCQEPFSDVSVDQLNELLKLCGAATVNSPAELTKNRRHSMIIVQTDDDISPAVQRKAASWFDRLQVLTVSREWVLDCLASYQLLPVRSQLIGKHSESMLRIMGFDSHLLA